MDPASAMLLFVLFQATEKVIGYAGGKVADSVTKPIWEALDEKAKWISGKGETTKRWEGFSSAFADARVRLESDGRHPDVVKQVLNVLEQYNVTDPADKDWLNDLSMELEKASLISEKPDEFLLVELFSHALSNQGGNISRAELSETIADFISIFQNSLFAQSAYREDMFKHAQWQKMREARYDTRERYIAQIIDHYENLDFVGIPELKDRQALRIEDVFISLQTQIEETDFKVPDEVYDLTEATAREELNERNRRAHLGETRQKVTRRLSVNQALGESNKIVVLGDPGSGKTTLLKYIVLAYAENKTDKLGLTETRLPIFIRLYDYVTKREAAGLNGFSFTDYLKKYCTDNLQLRLAPDFFEQLLERGECCVCFDGLDELGTAGIRREITSAVAAMANRYPRNRFIVTSRIIGYDEAPLNRRDFEHHTVQPLSDEGINSFVEKWYRARERDAVVRMERTEHLTNTIMGEERIKSLASNPLMLTIIALVHRIEAELPHERVKLYDKCVTTLTETWDKVRGIKTISRRRLLEKIAYWMHSQPGEKGRTREVREGTLRLQLAHFLRSDPKNNLDDDAIQTEVNNFITLVKKRSGLLVERGENVYSFSHLTFQEYLAASDIEKRLAHSTEVLWEEIKPPKLHDAHWREVILLLLGSLNRFEAHNSILVRKIFEGSDIYEPILHRFLFLCGQVLSDRVEVDIELHAQIIEVLFQLALSDELQNFNAIQTLAFMQNDLHVVDRLLLIAVDEKVGTDARRETLKALGKLGRADEGVLNRLLAIAGNEKVEVGVRSEAAQALGQLGRADEAVLNGLLAIAGDEEEGTYVRSDAARALGQLGRADEGVLNGLLAIAGDVNVGTDLRIDAAQALGELGRADEAGKILLAMARDAKELYFFTGSKAVRALGEIGSTEEAVLNGLLAIVGDEQFYSFTRSEAARALGKLGRADEGVLNRLLGIAGDVNVGTDLRIEAARALGQLGRADEAEMILLAIAGNEKLDARVRSEGARAMGQLGSANNAVLNGLLAIAGDKKVNADLRRDAAQAMGRLGSAVEAGKMLLAIVGDEKVDARVRSDAARALGQLGRADKGVLNGLLAIAGDVNVGTNTRRETLKALGQLGRMDKGVLNGLLEIVEDEKVGTYVRSEAAQALVQLGCEDEAGKFLLAIAGDERVSARVRVETSHALGQLGLADEAGKFLLLIAGDENVVVKVRNDAAQALRKLLG